MLRLEICDYSDAYFDVKGRITVEGTNYINERKSLTFKNNFPFRLCISKIKNTFVNYAEDLDIVMLMYNLLECTMNCYYYITTGSLWNYYRDEVNDDANEIVVDYKRNNRKTTATKFFEYKTKIIQKINKNKHRSCCSI